jgi:nucleoside-diphosphate-sugar epimerase
MKALLTGITGNLGYELAHWLKQSDVEVIPCVRSVRTGDMREHFSVVIETDLTLDDEINITEDFDCIIHCAGVVHFQKSSNQNEAMMRTVVGIAKSKNIPLYHISTAFVCRPDDGVNFNNLYESDKYNAERVLLESGIPCAIFRPSVLVGSSRDGAIRNFSGYYSVVEAFWGAIMVARKNSRILRFPKMRGESNIVPIDIAANVIGRTILQEQRGVVYVTNPKPPCAMWILDETLDFFHARKDINVLDITFEEFGSLDLNPEEAALYRFSKHFNPYWSMEYSFPHTACPNFEIDHDYMVKILNYFQSIKNSHE